MQTLSQIKALLAERGLRPRHRFGQNFLHDHNFIRKLLTAASISADDLVLEVGPGTGTLTEALVEAGAEVVVCEIDHHMAQIVESCLGKRIRLVCGDCLASKHVINPELIASLGSRSFKLVANLPYNIASPLMINLLIDHPACSGMWVTIQSEVADRLLAQPSTKAYGALTVTAQSFATIERIATVPPTCFWPQPEVTSAMICLLPSPPGKGAGGEGTSKGGTGVASVSPTEDRREFARFVTMLFSKRRKQLGSIFGRDHVLPEGITPDQRPDSLSPRCIQMLWRTIRPNPRGPHG